MARNTHNRLLDHEATDLDTNAVLDGALGAPATTASGQTVHQALVNLNAAIAAARAVVNSVSGIPGEPGEDGAMGPPGPPGPAGAQGPAGEGGTGSGGGSGYFPDDGEQGEMGPPGPRGETGVTGSQGPMGPGGPPMWYPEDGEDGAPGSPGPRGEPGAAGATGDTGPAGNVINSGWPPGYWPEDGEEGPMGPPGRDGGGSPDVDPVTTKFGAPDTAYEFNTSSLTGLTAIGTPTTEDANTTIPGCLYYKDSTSGTAIMGRYLASPATPFTAIVKILDHSSFANHNFAGLLLGVADPTTGAIVIHEVGRLGRFLVIEKFTNRTTFSSAFSTGTIATWTPLYLAAVVNSTTSVDYWYSMNGWTWRKFLSAHDPSMTIGSVGVGMRSENSGGHTVAFDYLRIWNSAKTFI